MKKKLNIPLIITAVIIVALVAMVGVIGLKFKGDSSEEAINESVTEEIQTEVIEKIEEITSLFSDEAAEETGFTENESESNIDTAVIASETTSKAAESTTKAKETTTAAESATEDMEQVQEEVTVPELSDMSTGKGSVATASNTKDLPKDMSFAGLYGLGYDVIGLKEYIYNDDMADDCTQRKYGYNSFYDNAASLIDFTIDTVKLKFNYDGKTYRIQLWKGQYISGSIGTVGGEVGIYTKKGENSKADHFDCAGSGDELYQEMTILWDDDGDGVYTSQLTRNYSLHWWQTGYVDGQLKNKRDSSPLRLLSHMTFKDEEQAEGFASALSAQGFTLVDTFDPTVKDTYKISGKDVIYIWQDVR